MKNTGWLVVVLALAACDMKTDGQKKKEAEEAARQAASNAAPPPRPEPPEEAHVLVKADPANVSAVQAGKMGLVRVARDGVIACAFLEGPKRVNIGATATGGCCSSNDPPEMQMMGGTFDLVRDGKCGTDSPPCDQPVLLDGDYKAPWLHVRTVLEMMGKGHMTTLVFATSADAANFKGVVAKLPAGWKPTDDLPATAKKIEVAAKGKELAITIDGTVYKDVASAVAALQKAGVKEIAIHPADSKTPLWAVVKGVEVSNSIAPAGPVRFVMLDK